MVVKQGQRKWRAKKWRVNKGDVKKERKERRERQKRTNDDLERQGRRKICV